METLLYLFVIGFVGAAAGGIYWFINRKRKQTQVKALVYGKDKRVKVYYRVPSKSDTETNITIEGKTYVVNDKDFFLDSKGYPTYTYRIDSTEPLDPFDSKKSVLSPDYYNTAINSHVARDIFESTQKGLDGNMLVVVLTAVNFMGLLFVAYLMYDNFNFIGPKVEEILNLLKTLGGLS